MQELIDYYKNVNFAVTICDKNAVVLYMNDKAKKTFERFGDVIGKSLFNCHKPESAEKIRHMLATGSSNAYTIQKGDVKKIIYQTPWEKDGEVAGLIEISIELPENLPHFVR